MRYCEHCGCWAEERAKFCTNCGMKLPVWEMRQPTPAKEDEEEKNAVRKKALIFLLVLTGFTCVYCMRYGIKVDPSLNTNLYNAPAVAETQKEEIGTHTDVEAFVCAKDIVEHNLKAPSTAKFCRITEAEIEYLGNGEYWVKGWVDAENGFGAMIRSSFQVKYTALIKGDDIGYKNAECHIY